LWATGCSMGTARSLPLVPDLIASIQEYINAHNDDPKPYVWTATAESIRATVARARSPSKNSTESRTHH